MSIEQTDAPTVNDPNERAVLLAMAAAESPVPTIAQIAADTGLRRSRVRSIVRAFHEHGLAEFGPLMREDECVMAGRGYWLSARGVAARDRARERSIPCAHIADYYQRQWERQKCIGFNLLRHGYRQCAEGRASEDEQNNLYGDAA